MFANGDKSQLASWVPNKEGTNMLQSMIRSKVYSGDAIVEEKLVKYQLFWKYYNNNHWAKNNDKLLSFNYVRAIVDKVNNFMVSDEGFELNIKDTYGGQVSLDLDRIYEALLNFNWRQNSKKTLLKKILQMGGITGDAYVFLYPNADGFISFKLMDTRTCIPVFNNGDYNDIIGYRIVQPLIMNEKEYIQKVFKYTKETTEIYYVKDTGEDAPKFEMNSSTNIYQFIPIVHIENIPMSDSFGGKSDVEDIVKINKIYNEMAEDVKMIIDYYAQPTTVITGGTVGALKRGINQIWSGLPADAHVFNLALGEDLSASMSYLKLLKESMHDLTGVPEEVLSKVQHISNTSASALQMLYQSLIQVSDIKAVSYGEGIEKINKMTTLMYSQSLGEHPLFVQLVDQIKREKIFGDSEIDIRAFVIRYVTDVRFKYALPNDRLQMLNEINIELSANIASRREVMERLGKSNIATILKQIDEDIELKKQIAQDAKPAVDGGLPPAEDPENGKVPPEAGTE